MANEPETVAARASADAYAERLLMALRDEAPGLDLLGTSVQDWCVRSQCRLDIHHFFGVDDDLLASLARIDAVLRRESTSAPTGLDGIQADRPGCAEFSYRMPWPEGITGAQRDSTEPLWPWESTVFFTGTADPGAGCAIRLRPAAASRSAHVVGTEEVDTDALLAEAVGKHRYIVRIGVGGRYATAGRMR